IDDALGDEVRVTVIAAGFDGGMPKRRDSGSAFNRPLQTQTQAQTREAAQQLAQSGGARPAPAPANEAPAAKPEPAPAETPVAERPRVQRKVEFDGDDLDIPDFLK